MEVGSTALLYSSMQTKHVEYLTIAQLETDNMSTYTTYPPVSGFTLRLVLNRGMGLELPYGASKQVPCGATNIILAKITRCTLLQELLTVSIHLLEGGVCLLA